MKFYNGDKGKKNYFEGWYFKQNCDNLNISFIPTISMTNNIKRCFIQVITTEFSHTFEFNFNDFYASKDTLDIKIKDNVFNQSGIDLYLEDEDYRIIVKLNFNEFLQLKKNIMGLFSIFPFMECKHSIISMKHAVNGTITINDVIYYFKDSIGYIEKDYGTSFPTNYLWIQCNAFNNDVSFFFSKATIPYLGFKFKGLICSLLINRKEYRFATYNCSKIVYYEKNHLKLKRGRYTLDVYYIINEDQPLKAPKYGVMKREVFECINGLCFITLKYKNKTIFEAQGTHAGIESGN